jgi:hypothetical protein
MEDVEFKRNKCIRNSEGLYASVFKAHGIDLKRNEELYYSTEKVPPLNSNVCTKSPLWHPDEIFTEIRARAEKEKWESWSIKDSFACLPLKEYGFEKLFDAQWLYIPAKTSHLREPHGLSFEPVLSDADLERWVRLWGEEENLYTSIMLGDPDLFFVIGREDGEERCAALLNRTDDVIGVSNFFPQSKIAERWSDLLHYIYEAWGPIDVVGYERKEILDALLPLGAENAGDLTIWITFAT